MNRSWDVLKVTDYQFLKISYLEDRFWKDMNRLHPVYRPIFSVLTILVYAFLYIYTAIIVLLIYPLALIGSKSVVKALLWFWANSAFIFMIKRIRVIGKSNISKGTKYILVANHTSSFDILAIMSFYPDVAFFGREYLTKIPVFGKVLRMNDYVPMRSTDLRNTKEMLEQLKEKSSRRTVAIFPEGTRTRTGKMNRFRKGFIHLIKATGYDVLPVTLHGFFDFKPATRFYIDFRSKLRVVIHKPIENKLLVELDDKEIADQVRSVLESKY